MAALTALWIAALTSLYLLSEANLTWFALFIFMFVAFENRQLLLSNKTAISTGAWCLLLVLVLLPHELLDYLALALCCLALAQAGKRLSAPVMQHQFFALFVWFVAEMVFQAMSLAGVQWGGLTQLFAQLIAGALTQMGLPDIHVQRNVVQSGGFSTIVLFSCLGFRDLILIALGYRIVAVTVPDYDTRSIKPFVLITCIFMVMNLIRMIINSISLNTYQIGHGATGMVIFDTLSILSIILPFVIWPKGRS